MKVGDKHYRSIWLKPDDDKVVQVIDQRFLPHKFVVEDLKTTEEVATAIKEMHVRGAPLIGVTAAYGIYFACIEAKGQDNPGEYLIRMSKMLGETRPTAVNLHWAIDKMMGEVAAGNSCEEKTKIALASANRLADEDAEICRMIGVHGLELIKKISEKKNGEPVNILTHCNAGWLATVDYGTATSVMYHAHDAGIPIHVWVDETRPRNQGALTAWELGNHGIPHTFIVDNAGGHLMQHGMVDIVITGSDRTTIQGDVANKIGTYLKALAANDNKIPFYVALPESTFDFRIRDGLAEIPIETRSEDEVHLVNGNGNVARVTPEGSPVINYGFDVTPARLVTGLITERGVCEASEDGILRMFPEFQPIA